MYITWANWFLSFVFICFICWVSCLNRAMHCELYSIALVKFAGRDDQYVVVGTVKDLQLRPRSLTCGYLLLYKLSHTGDQLELVHRTEVDELPAAIAPFQGRLLVGVGRYLRIYDYGKKKLLRKCENKVRS